MFWLVLFKKEEAGAGDNLLKVELSFYLVIDLSHSLGGKKRYFSQH